MLKSILGNSSSSQAFSSAVAVRGLMKLVSDVGYSPRHSTVTRLGVVAACDWPLSVDNGATTLDVFTEYRTTGGFDGVLVGAGLDAGLVCCRFAAAPFDDATLL